MMAIVYYTDGRTEHIDTPNLEKAMAIIGGWAELVAPKRSMDIVFLCDEDGLQKKLPLNLMGCALYGPSNPVVGPIIVMKRAEARKAGWL